MGNTAETAVLMVLLLSSQPCSSSSPHCSDDLTFPGLHPLLRQVVAPHAELHVELGSKSGHADFSITDAVSDADLAALASMPVAIKVKQLTLPSTYYTQPVRTDDRQLCMPLTKGAAHEISLASTSGKQ